MMHYGHFPPFGFFFFLVMIGLIITNIIMWKRGRGNCYNNRIDAVNVLENRLAKGEVSIEEYKEIKETLRG
ncbi:hypothetical protein ACFVR1_05615 [Psychrobacillus sp. NPDC058041]|uniref:hypothetical protein n=1 Tax=Psychrobacillus sp. NPDC058041 TaxID=3346310 RepID=UPI0036DDCC4F